MKRTKILMLLMLLIVAYATTYAFEDDVRRNNVQTEFVVNQECDVNYSFEITIVDPVPLIFKIMKQSICNYETTFEIFCSLDNNYLSIIKKDMVVNQFCINNKKIIKPQLETSVINNYPLKTYNYGFVYADRI